MTDVQMEQGVFAANRPIWDLCAWAVTHRYFEWTIMAMILVSSVGLACDTPYLNP